MLGKHFPEKVFLTIHYSLYEYTIYSLICMVLRISEQHKNNSKTFVTKLCFILAVGTDFFLLCFDEVDLNQPGFFQHSCQIQRAMTLTTTKNEEYFFLLFFTVFITQLI